MLSVRGVIQDDNTVIVEDEDIRSYKGKEVIVTILDYPYKEQKEKVDLKKYMGRGEKLFQTDAQEYIREMRDNDRI